MMPVSAVKVDKNLNPILSPEMFHKLFVEKIPNVKKEMTPIMIPMNALLIPKTIDSMVGINIRIPAKIRSLLAQ